MRKQLPHEGEPRIVLMFPVLPIKTRSNEIAWFEFIVVEQRYEYARVGSAEGWKNMLIHGDISKAHTAPPVGLIAKIFAWIYL